MSTPGQPPLADILFSRVRAPRGRPQPLTAAGLLAASGLLASACTLEPHDPDMPPFAVEGSTSAAGDESRGDSTEEGQLDSSGSEGAASSTSGSPPEPSTGEPPPGEPPPGCGEVMLPEGDRLVELDAADGVEHSGGAVDRWINLADPDSSFTPQGSAPQWVEGVLEGHPIVRFDGQGQQLFASVGIEGREELTIAIVSATTTLWYPGDEWCQADFGLERYEQGCSGTYNTPIMWDEDGDWGFTFVGAGQEWISYRFGTGVKSYSDLDDPEIAALGYDPRVVWRRPASIGEAFTLTTLVKHPNDFAVYVDDELVYEDALPQGTGPLVNVTDTVHLGGGRGDRYWGGDIAAVVVYGRALDDTEVATLDQALGCRFSAPS